MKAIHGHCKGGRRSSAHSTWTGIITRCTNPKQKNYRNYGGRGVTVCERWRNSFEAFLEDVGEKPSPKHTIDRIDNSKGYEPGNVRWATMTEQHRNKRNNRRITIDGETHCITEWEDIKNLPRYMIRNRLARGWSEQDAVLTPSKGKL